MFVRIKKSGHYEYLQIVQSERQWGQSKQKMIASLGRLDQNEEGMALNELGHSLLAMYKEIRERKKKVASKRKKR